MHCRQAAQDIKLKTTWSPGRTLTTLGPTFSTMPAPSCPSTIGCGTGYIWSRTIMSVWHMPVATIRTSTSSSRGSPMRNFSMVKGPPLLRTTAAVTAFDEVGPGMIPPLAILFSELADVTIIFRKALTAQSQRPAKRRFCTCARSASVPLLMDAVQPVKLEDSGPSPETAGVTPMMEQYVEIKTANPDCLLFYRMGDFYELFFDDAEIASRALGIVLTKRGKHLGRDIPMCGVPVERADEYLHRLIALGHRVAVCEQLEDPAEARKRGAKSIVRRDVVRLVTPGTLTEDSLLDAKSNNYLLALSRNRASSTEDRFALAWIDISTGDFHVAECERNGLSVEIARIEPS